MPGEPGMRTTAAHLNKQRHKHRPEKKDGAATTTVQETMETVRSMVTWFYPDLHSRAYFLPPVYFNRESFKQTSVAGLSVLVPEPPPDCVPRHHPAPTSGQTHPSRNSPDVGEAAPVPRALWPQQDAAAPQTLTPYADSHVREDVAQQHVLHCLAALARESREVMFVISQLGFSSYLNQPAYAATASLLPHAASLPAHRRRGDFDLLVIHRRHGILVAEIKAVGMKAAELQKSLQDADLDIARRVGKALKQLDKSEAVVRHLVSDVASQVRVRKTLVLPYINKSQLKRMLAAHSDLEQKLCRCLGAAEQARAADLCLCADMMTKRETPWDVTDDVMANLQGWWRHQMADDADQSMTPDLYLDLVARFGGPATTVSIHSVFPPRLEVRTEGQGVSETGERIIRLVLTPDQLRLLHAASSRMFLTGPPGTGKTVVMVLMGLQWLRQGHDVFVLGVDEYSRAASHLIHRQLQATLRADPALTSDLGKPHLLQYDFLKQEADVQHALHTLTVAAESRNQELHVLCDEFTPDISRDGQRYQAFVNDLLARVPKVHLWTAGLWNNNAPAGLQVEPLTVPLRCAPVVQREVEKGFIRVTASSLYTYSTLAAPAPCDGPGVIRLSHQGPRHTHGLPVDCEECGKDIASVLTRQLHVGNTAPPSITPDLRTVDEAATVAPPALQYRDVLVFVRAVLHDDDDTTTDGAGCTPLVRALRQAGVPVKVLRNSKGQARDWAQDVCDVALGQHDHVTVANYRDVSGLERKVVVWVPGRLAGRDDDRSDDDLEARGRLYAMSRCTAQLIVVQLPRDAISNCREADAEESEATLQDLQQNEKNMLETPEP